MAIKQFDLKRYLEEKLDDSFSVVNIRELDATLDGDKAYVVITDLPSSIFPFSATFQYQIDIYTDKPELVTEKMNQFVTEYNGISFVSESNHFRPFFTTPSPMERDIKIGTNNYVRLVIFVTANAMFGVNDISIIKIDGEELNTLNITVPYTVQAHPKKISGEELSTNIKETSTTQIIIKIIPQNNLFISKIASIRQGKLSGMTIFETSLEFTNGAKEYYNTIVLSSTLVTARGQVPSMDITLGLVE